MHEILKLIKTIIIINKVKIVKRFATYLLIYQNYFYISFKNVNVLVQYLSAHPNWNVCCQNISNVNINADKSCIA